MLRLPRLVLCALLALAGCHHDPAPIKPAEGELPPLPPSSGTPVGYLIDNSSQLALTDEQISKLKKIDESLQAANDGIDTQLREIEKPDEEQPEKGKPPPRYNNAPGRGAIKTTSDASKLHDARNANSRDALERAFALLDAKQQPIARRLLDDRGVAAPGPGKQQPAPKTEDDTGGVPVEP